MSVLIAILVRNKAPTLPLFLRCLLNQTFSKSNTFLYIRENDSTDDSEAILKQWVNEHRHKYLGVYEDYSPVYTRNNDAPPPPSSDIWTAERFKTLGAIRQDSIDYALKHGFHYFVVDADNFIYPHVISSLFENREIGVVAPILYLPCRYYSNYHSKVTSDGYCDTTDPRYKTIHERSIRGLIEVDVVHCCYFIAHKYLSRVSYDDDSTRHEYVIFSDVLRKAGIKQFLDTRNENGFITFARTADDFVLASEPFRDQLMAMLPES
jgi:glycosyltransferase involved in cell wall biosynthesis